MTIITDAKYVGRTIEHYQHNDTARISVKTHLFGSRITVYKIRGRNNDQPVTKLVYGNLAGFLQDWQDFNYIVEAGL